ncbi:unnamed protein product [Chrysoparadoxa australica]
MSFLRVVRDARSFLRGYTRPQMVPKEVVAAQKAAELLKSPLQSNQISLLGGAPPEVKHAAANDLFLGEEAVEDKAAAVELWKQASDAGHKPSTLSYARCLAEGQGVEPDAKMAVSLLTKLSNEGQGEAMYTLGLLKERQGQHARALDLYLRASRQGVKPALYNAANLMAQAKDDVNARDWYGKAAAAGDPQAMFTLGQWQQTGRGGEVNKAGALELLQRAAQAGLPQAQYNLGTHFLEEKEYKLAEEWLLLAAERGFEKAQLNLGKMYSTGFEGVPPNREKSLYWYRKVVPKVRDD